MPLPDRQKANVSPLSLTLIMVTIFRKKCTQILTAALSSLTFPIFHLVICSLLLTFPKPHVRSQKQSKEDLKIETAHSSVCPIWVSTFLISPHCICMRLSTLDATVYWVMSIVFKFINSLHPAFQSRCSSSSIQMNNAWLIDTWTVPQQMWWKAYYAQCCGYYYTEKCLTSPL